jgi:hypothetical protein
MTARSMPTPEKAWDREVSEAEVNRGDGRSCGARLARFTARCLLHFGCRRLDNRHTSSPEAPGRDRAYTGGFGRARKACAHRLMERGLTHFVASDAHDCTVRTPNLREAYAWLAERWDEEVIRPLFEENPKAALMGEAVEFEFRPGPARNRRWYQFWG